MQRKFTFLLMSLTLISIAGWTHAIAKEPAGRVEIVTDQKNGAVRIVIDGKPVMAIDKAGAHIMGDVIYSGSLFDVGPSDDVWGDKL